MDATSSSSGARDTAGGSSDTASTSYQAYPEMSAEQEYFLYELETSDDSSIGLVLRAVYDTGDVNKFTRALESRIAHYDKSIQKTCAHHYQSFVDAIRQLIELRQKCEDVKTDVAVVEKSVQECGKKLAERSAEIVKYRRLQKNTTTAIDHLAMCLPVLDNYARMQELLAQKKYYQALKVVEEIEHTHLALIEKYRFTQVLAKQIEPIRGQIRTAAYNEFTDFLETVKKHSFGSSEAGRAKRLHEEAQKSAANIDVEVGRDGQLIHKNSNANRSVVTRSSNPDEDESLSAQDLIDFTPVHRCCQIFSVLNESDQFQQHFQRQREQQSDVIIPPHDNRSSTQDYAQFLDEMIGFFVVEDHIQITEPSLAAPSHKDRLWRRALTRVVDVMDRRFGNCLDIVRMMEMKKVILLFAFTMANYGYPIEQLYQLLQNFRDQYNEILMKAFCGQFDTNLRDDNYTPIVVKDEIAFKKIVDAFPFYRRGMDSEPFPRTFPFSMFVVKAFDEAKRYLEGCHTFMEHLKMTDSEIDDTVRRYRNVLLERWSGSLKNFVASRERSLIELVQVTINIGYLEASCKKLSEYISRLTGRAAESGGGHLVRMQDLFRDARSEAEQRIDEALQAKVDAFLGDATYDWRLVESTGRASTYVSDLLDFLTGTFLSFTNLPNQLARHVCMQICKYLASRFKDMLLSSDIVSPGALEQFSLDVMQCELFTARCPVAGFEDNALQITFASLRQLIELATLSDWATYFAEQNRSSEGSGKYARVSTSDAAALVERLIEFEKRSSSLTGGGAGAFLGIRSGAATASADRKKLLDTILRQLRALANQ